MATREVLRRQLQSTDTLRSVVQTMKALATVRIGQVRRAVEALDASVATLELGFQVLLREDPDLADVLLPSGSDAWAAVVVRLGPRHVRAVQRAGGALRGRPLRGIAAEHGPPSLLVAGRGCARGCAPRLRGRAGAAAAGQRRRHRGRRWRRWWRRSRPGRRSAAWSGCWSCTTTADVGHRVPGGRAAAAAARPRLAARAARASLADAAPADGRPRRGQHAARAGAAAPGARAGAGVRGVAGGGERRSPGRHGVRRAQRRRAPAQLQHAANLERQNAVTAELLDVQAAYASGRSATTNGVTRRASLGSRVPKVARMQWAPAATAARAPTRLSSRARHEVGSTPSSRAARR
jgi:hypothetical protein